MCWTKTHPTYMLTTLISVVKLKHFLDLISLCSTWKILDEGDHKGVQVS